jgi:hypothetical protein
MLARTRRLLALPSRYHFWGSLGIVLFVAFVVSAQVTDRTGFANADLHRDVMERWGAPIQQAAPSIRYVSSGSLFQKLAKLPLEAQQIEVQARMNYRKRGLVYFSGFDFEFRGSYRVENPEPHDVDLVFVFPVQLARNKVLLSELAFRVDGELVGAPLAEGDDKLVWTGRLARGEGRSFEIRFKGRGLDSFSYVPDPALPVRNLELVVAIEGGSNYDYAEGVVPAAEAESEDGSVRLAWRYASLESGVPMGVILPSEESFDRIIATIVRRAWAPFVLLFGALVALSLHARRPLLFYESYLVAAGYGLFLVLLAYLAAYLHFYVAYALSCAAIGLLLLRYLAGILGGEWRSALAALLVAFLLVPTLAVVLEGYTGLVYTLEILTGLGVLMALSVRPELRAVLAELAGAMEEEDAA